MNDSTKQFCRLPTCALCALIMRESNVVREMVTSKVKDLDVSAMLERRDAMPLPEGDSVH